MSETMELSRDPLETIGGCVKQNLSTWMRETAMPRQTDPVLLEQMDKRFDQAHRHTNHWMTFLSIVLLALTTVVSLGFFFAG